MAQPSSFPIAATILFRLIDAQGVAGPGHPAGLPAAGRHCDSARFQQSFRFLLGIVTGGVHSIAEVRRATEDRVLALLDVGRTPVSLAMKPDGGEMIVCNFDSDSISIVETGNDEVGSSQEIGHHPARGWSLSTTPGCTSRTSDRIAWQSMTSIWDANLDHLPWAAVPSPGPDARSELSPRGRYGIRGRNHHPEAQAPPHLGNVGVFSPDVDTRGRAAQRNRYESIHGSHAEALGGPKKVFTPQTHVASNVSRRLHRYAFPAEAIECRFQIGRDCRGFARFDVAALHEIDKLRHRGTPRWKARMADSL